MEKSLDTRHNSITWTEAETVGYQQNNREQSKQVCHGKMTFCLYLIEKKEKKRQLKNLKSECETVKDT